MANKQEKQSISFVFHKMQNKMSWRYHCTERLVKTIKINDTKEW